MGPFDFLRTFCLAIVYKLYRITEVLQSLLPLALIKYVPILSTIEDE